MDFKPDEKLLNECVLKMENRTDTSGIQIEHIQIQDDVPINTNNSSKVIRIQVEYKADGCSKVAALAVKIPFLRSKVVYEGGKRQQFFVKEALFYRSIAPLLQRALHAEVTPTLLASDMRQVLYLEDLCGRGYRVHDNRWLDAEHSAVTLQHLAGMHAASHVLCREDAGCIDQLIRQQFLISAQFIEKVYIEVKPLLGALARVQCITGETVGRFDSAVEKATADIGANMESQGFNFCVLNHGDLKTPNILFKYDERCRPVCCSLIDFQVCHWSSPALDIVFFTILSMNPHVLNSNFDNLLRSYLLTLNSTLKKLNCSVQLTEGELRHDLAKVKAFKIASFLFKILIDIREYCKKFDYSEIEDISSETIEKLSQLAEIQESVGFWLGEFERSGVL